MGAPVTSVESGPHFDAETRIRSNNRGPGYSRSLRSYVRS